MKFSVADISNNIYQCHCSLCRKQTGSASNSGAITPLRQLKWIKGKDNIKSWITETGFRSDFCDNCGSPVPNPLKRHDFYWIPVGCLEDAPFNIVANLCTESKATWSFTAPTGKQFKMMPEIEELTTLLFNHGHT